MSGVRVPTMDDPIGNPAAPVLTPLDALQVMASSDVMLTPTLRHVEMYTMRGLLTLLRHELPAEVAVQPGALVLCGGAMGGLLGPGDALYHRLGEQWSRRGVPVLQGASYRKPNDLDLCCVDLAAAVQLAIGGAGADKVVLMGHSFGGCIAVRVRRGPQRDGRRHCHLRHAVGGVRGGRGLRDAAAAVHGERRRDPAHRGQ